MTYRTCIGCVFAGGHCAEREKVRTQVKGLGVRSIKWACSWKRLDFRPGDPVWAETTGGNADSEEDAGIGKYAAVFIENRGTRGIVFVAPDTPDEWGEAGDFTPLGDRDGHCRIPLSRLTKRDGIRQNVCHYCRQVTQDSDGHDDWCPTQSRSWLGDSQNGSPFRSAQK